MSAPGEYFKWIRSHGCIWSADGSRCSTLLSLNPRKEGGGASAINIRKFLLQKSFTRSHTGAKAKGGSSPANGSVLESRVITATPYLLLLANCSFLAASTSLRMRSRAKVTLGEDDNSYLLGPPGTCSPDE
ncbi:hypothetical protein CEXT_282071 [Caerostris extrusa]|uniref:Uncharacterized protein n=1 Tax=Caerostris extrusa TaxID=172846 RepID=A0AAV4MVL2_CAEEX|nr:hypothetical protein CEXT_282071 [Caerostris extrusa]